jgi:flagellar basal body-associated protein FliL
VLKILGSRSIEELSDITRRNELKETLRTAVNGILAEGEVKRLYFTRYVLQ